MLAEDCVVVSLSGVTNNKTSNLSRSSLSYFNSRLSDGTQITWHWLDDVLDALLIKLRCALSQMDGDGMWNAAASASWLALRGQDRQVCLPLWLAAPVRGRLLVRCRTLANAAETDACPHMYANFVLQIIGYEFLYLLRCANFKEKDIVVKYYIRHSTIYLQYFFKRVKSENLKQLAIFVKKIIICKF